ncbi:TRAP transporter small permease [Pseudohalocynthiibacter sp. F2068]|jgi:C4-dicarboxylate transporter, DctQ subunit|uniref:TRAP transporter small permease subunit n=1 Tax=Pseudohalocynthiibacter sp. F2068 TaxID=2926418 RepID=UPI001FF33DD3|nr:TRAP transporter small permease [Pseudohalocynthiibacter sp. F2068]MCK0103280.1 TRAP transporter small permease [Pseudohalocynthiibacter sp. F2068]
MADITNEREPERVAEAIPQAGAFGKVINAFGIVFAIAILSSAAILFLEVILRYGLNRPTIWAHETVIFLTACSFVFGGLYVASRNAHIRVVLIYDQLGAAKRRRFDVAISVACSFACAVFAWASWQSVVRAVWTPTGDFRLETSGSAWDPPTPGLVKVFLFIVLILMALQFAILAFNYLRKPVGR